jgi:hypothetical protein
MRELTVENGDLACRIYVAASTSLNGSRRIPPKVTSRAATIAARASTVTLGADSFVAEGVATLLYNQLMS